MGIVEDSKVKRHPSKLSLISAPLLWLTLIWTLSSIPGRDLQLGKILSMDKLAHWGIYLILCLLVNRMAKGLGLKRKSVRTMYLALILSAALDEYHQTYIPGRSVTVFDFFANALGIASGYLIGILKRDFSN